MFDRIRTCASRSEPLNRFPAGSIVAGRTVPAAEEVLAKLPTGPVTGHRQPDGRRWA